MEDNPDINPRRIKINQKILIRKPHIWDKDDFIKRNNGKNL